MTPHYFIGIRVPPETAAIAEEFRVKYRLSDLYKVIPDEQDLHITLRYIGEMDDEQLARLQTVLIKAASSHTHFKTAITGLSFFGSPSGPRVIYLAVIAMDKLRQLQKQVSRVTEEMVGLDEDPRFVPHITIAKKRKTTEKLQLHKDSIDPFTLEIEGFSLFKIHPRQTPSYEEVCFFPLKKS